MGVFFKISNVKTVEICDQLFNDALPLQQPLRRQTYALCKGDFRCKSGVFSLSMAEIHLLKYCARKLTSTVFTHLGAFCKTNHGSCCNIPLFLRDILCNDIAYTRTSPAIISSILESSLRFCSRHDSTICGLLRTDIICHETSICRRLSNF